MIKHAGTYPLGLKTDCQVGFLFNFFSVENSNIYKINTQYNEPGAAITRLYTCHHCAVSCHLHPPPPTLHAMIIFLHRFSG